jgi:catechol 2,3-dioxygenase-like lactoylglutathione lyase family enzyme
MGRLRGWRAASGRDERAGDRAFATTATRWPRSGKGRDKMSVPVHGLSELVLEVRDLEKAEQFYGEVLGFELQRWNPRVSVAEAPGCRIQLRLYGTPGHRGAGPCHFAFSVRPEVIDSIAAHLDARGLLARGPEDFGEHGRAVFCFDPDGNEVEFQDYFCRKVEGK